MYHYRKTRALYIKRLNHDGCPFCKPETLAEAVYKNKLIYIVPNLTQYDLWETHDVEDHLMIIPIRHVEALSELTKEERLAVMDAAAEYEGKGYSVYARGVGFIRRSVKHQHTHLIKVSDKKPRIVFFLQKPYYLLKK